MISGRSSRFVLRVEARHPARVILGDTKVSIPAHRPKVEIELAYYFHRLRKSDE